MEEAPRNVFIDWIIACANEIDRQTNIEEGYWMGVINPVIRNYIMFRRSSMRAIWGMKRRCSRK